jgi:hypothetical protein
VQTQSTSPATTRRAAITTTTRSPATVKVLVANGTNTTGLANTAKALIQARGFDATSVQATTAAVAAKRNTTVYYQAGYEVEARTIAGILALTPAPPIVPMPATGLPVSDAKGSHILVLIGPDYAAKVSGTSATTSPSRTTSTTRKLTP